MALDFTRLSDVTLVEEATETANVLIEEGGEIKRVPKTEVGGGKSEYDAVIRVNWADGDGPVLVSGSYQAIYDKVMVQEEEPKIKIISKCDNYGMWYGVNSSSVSVLVRNPEEDYQDIVILFMSEYYDAGLSCLNLLPDNTFN